MAKPKPVHHLAPHEHLALMAEVVRRAVEWSYIGSNDPAKGTFEAALYKACMTYRESTTKGSCPIQGVRPGE